MVCPQTNNTPHEYKVASSLKNGINNTRKVTINETKILKIKRSNIIEYLQPIITQYFIDNKSEIWLLFLIAHSKR